MGATAVLDAVVKRKILSPRRESNPRTLILHPVAQRYLTTPLSPRDRTVPMGDTGFDFLA
jgi:hypothetical protein